MAQTMTMSLGNITFMDQGHIQAQATVTFQSGRESRRFQAMTTREDRRAQKIQVISLIPLPRSLGMVGHSPNLPLLRLALLLVSDQYKERVPISISTDRLSSLS